MTTSWLWQNTKTGGVQGAELDIESGQVDWHDDPGCSCSSNPFSQSFNDFLENGAYGGTPPEDVLAEMRAAIRAIKTPQKLTT